MIEPISLLEIQQNRVFLKEILDAAKTGGDLLKGNEA